MIFSYNFLLSVLSVRVAR